MFSMRRSCQSAAQSYHAHPNLTSALVHGQRRALSRSAACSRGALPVFVQPSTPALSPLLATFNSKVLLPMHLNKEQKKLVYAQENKAKLEAEPVEVTLGDVTLPLEPLNRNHLPDRFKSLRDIVRQSETPEDWENVVRLLEGFQSAGLQPKPQWQELVVRQLGDAGMQHLVLKALQRVKATGLRLTDHDVVAQVLKCIHDKAAKANWDQEETTKALRMAKQVTELMEDKEHHGAQPDTDHRRDPVVIALPTELAAVLAQKHGGDKAEVKKLANRLVAALKQSKYLVGQSALSPNMDLRFLIVLCRPNSTA
ncbi:hypothetical protein NX059_009995 [Plenodomus lindquistii]|nr:hypothetical protein NX059_009995 [Plenodomus lindquistii]